MEDVEGGGSMEALGMEGAVMYLGRDGTRTVYKNQKTLDFERL
jgi:hypothetical protein